MSNFPSDWNENQIRALFTFIGEIEFMELKDGVAHIYFKEAEAVSKAENLAHGSPIKIVRMLNLPVIE